MLPDRDRIVVGQTAENAAAALDFTGCVSRETVSSDRLVGFAVVRAVQLVGQAARHVSDAVRAANPDVPWRQMIGMRNVVVHDYADVDMALVWKTVREDLPGLVERLSTMLEDSGTS